MMTPVSERSRAAVTALTYRSPKNESIATTTTMAPIIQMMLFIGTSPIAVSPGAASAYGSTQNEADRAVAGYRMLKKWLMRLRLNAHLLRSPGT